MYDIIYNVIGHTWESGSNATNTTLQQIVCYTCATLILILVVTFIDLIIDLFRSHKRR